MANKPAVFKTEVTSQPIFRCASFAPGGTGIAAIGCPFRVQNAWTITPGGFCQTRRTSFAGGGANLGGPIGVPLLVNWSLTGSGSGAAAAFFELLAAFFLVLLAAVFLVLLLAFVAICLSFQFLTPLLEGSETTVSAEARGVDFAFGLNRESDAQRCFPFVTAEWTVNYQLAGTGDASIAGSEDQPEV